MAVAPLTEIDLFAGSDQPTRHEQYRALRDLGPVVRLSEPDVYAVTRYEEVKAALADHDTFRSGEGVGFNPQLNQMMQGIALVSDGAEHEQMRSIVGAPLQPGPLRARSEEIAEQARGLVAALVAKGEIDGVTEMAQAMPMLVMPDLLGLPERNRENLYDWAKGGTDLMGPVTERSEQGARMIGNMVQFTHELAANREFEPGTPGAAVLAAADDGLLPKEKCPLVFFEFLGSSLETTATLIGHLLVTFAQHPDQWAALRAEPGLVASAVNELLRYQSPLRGMTRVAARDTELGGVTIPQGARVWLLFASANRDERKWERPEEFDFRRNPLDHLSFGHGTHSCAGQGVARLELHALVHALLDAVERIEFTGDPVIAENTMMNTYDEIPVRLVAR
ncbi:monooxygenase [Kitasatospora sp. MMS16-BH015]|uniref:cytochrome P450 n=1 Tax=Kitasatospora sp. MMS16-BH015 TaxID=2018025 RepID=UPI000CA25A34|nr:cytochrome P450 [Kitasatospora sp. MMS16-BH015]AUG77609.1 monooxygenase [Kitasatospora sp. MMS16-BH015]